MNSSVIRRSASLGWFLAFALIWLIVLVPVTAERRELHVRVEEVGARLTLTVCRAGAARFAA